MANSKQIVYLSQSQYAELIANGSITVDGVTVTYDENDIYVTPQAEPVTDVRVNGTSVAANGTANIPVASTNNFGVIRVNSLKGTTIDNLGDLVIHGANENYIRSARSYGEVINPINQHFATFYGLAKIAGDTTQPDSNNPSGTYTPEAKAAIQKMLGVSDLIATEENNLVASKAYAIGDVFTANGKLYKATAAIAVDGAIITDGANANCEETSIGEGFVKNTDYATNNDYGIVKIAAGMGLQFHNSGGLILSTPTSNEIKAGTNTSNAIKASIQHESAFYGLAKAAGADEKDSTLPVGQYTDNAKAAIRTMIGATSDNVIAVQDTQPTDTDTKIWLPETEAQGIQVPTYEEFQALDNNAVKKTDYATASTYGIVKVSAQGGIFALDGVLGILPAGNTIIKEGTANYNPIVPKHQHEATFYGLAKAAGDTTQSVSDNAVGTYTADASAAIRSMLGAVGDVQANGTSIVSNGVANIPIGSNDTFGVYKTGEYGVTVSTMTGSEGTLGIASASSSEIKAGNGIFRPITASTQHRATFYGLAKAAGDTTQKVSDNAVGTYTDEAKSAIQTMLGIDLSSIASQVEIPLVETVTGTDVTINGQPNVRYNCGEVSTITINPPAAGSIDVIFTSGTSVAVLTLPSTVKMPAWFDATALETDTIYEILITDGTYGSVMTWAN